MPRLGLCPLCRYRHNGHWSGAPNRLGRDLPGSYGSKSYAREELVAEMTAAFTCTTLGITPTVRHADYIGSWLEVLREDDRAIVRAASSASKAAEFLLTFRPQTEASEGGGAVEDGEAVYRPCARTRPCLRHGEAG
jgi:antirestriction protein ArdC